MKSTCVFTTARFLCVPPCRIYFLPTCEIIQTAGINPDVQRKNRAQRGEDFLRLPALALLIDDVALQKDAASHGELRHRLRPKRSVRDLAERDAESFGNALQERAVT